jgi:hypothetical protein
MADARDEEVHKTLVDAYYRRVVDAPEAARRRAQNAYAVTGATAAGVATVGAFSDLADQPLEVQILGPLVLVAWLVTAGLYMWAVGAPYENPAAHTTVTGPNAFRDAVMDSAEAERDEIDRRQTIARGAAIAAVLLTLGVAALTLVLPAKSAFEDATLRLEPSARAALSELCERDLPSVLKSPLVDPGSLADATIDVKFLAGTCREQEVTTSLQKDEVTYLIAP